jgi:hypothetical protein
VIGQELLVAMPLGAGLGDPSGGHLQRGEQRGSAVSAETSPVSSSAGSVTSQLWSLRWLLVDGIPVVGRLSRCRPDGEELKSFGTFRTGLDAIGDEGESVVGGQVERPAF